MAPKTPLLIYGTAWKEETTAQLTETALENGFTGVDTANYPTAYNEPLTGDGITAAIQTKFTPVWAHNKDKIPFNPNQSIEHQVRESIKQSLEHLQVDYFDALFLHIYFENDEDNITAWKVFETFVPHTIRSLGVSNFKLSQLKELDDAVTVKPAFVQNRFYKETDFDFEVREFCTEHGILYQAYWMLKHNPEVLESEVLASVAEGLTLRKNLRSTFSS
ncbi:hypothetical protein ACHAQH_010076 [Verticillium albo-atrum]